MTEVTATVEVSAATFLEMKYALEQAGLSEIDDQNRLIVGHVAIKRRKENA